MEKGATEIDKMVTVSFDCDNPNHALLLITLFDIITDRPVEGSEAMIEFTGWLLDTIGGRLSEIDQYDTHPGEHNLHSTGVKVMELYTRKSNNLSGI